MAKIIKVRVDYLMVEKKELCKRPKQHKKTISSHRSHIFRCSVRSFVFSADHLEGYWDAWEAKGRAQRNLLVWKADLKPHTLHRQWRSNAMRWRLRENAAEDDLLNWHRTVTGGASKGHSTVAPSLNEIGIDCRLNSSWKSFARERVLEWELTSHRFLRTSLHPSH